MESKNPSPALSLNEPPGVSRPASFAQVARFWEWGRLPYNALLAAMVVIWIVATWPHFRPAFNLAALRFLVFAALMANLCYCAAYPVEFAMQRFAFSAGWKRWRWGLWVLGMLLALLLENYWIADEIYPFV